MHGPALVMRVAKIGQQMLDDPNLAGTELLVGLGILHCTLDRVAADETASAATLVHNVAARALGADTAMNRALVEAVIRASTALGRYLDVIVPGRWAGFLAELDAPGLVRPLTVVRH